ACREGSDRVVCRGLGPTEDRIDVRDLPIADRTIDGGPDLAPVEAGRVSGVDHALVLRGRARLLEEPPDLVEQTYRHFAMPLPLCRRGFACHGFPPPRDSFANGLEWGWADLNCRRRLFCPIRGGPKARRIDQATPQPQMRAEPEHAINTLSPTHRAACASRKMPPSRRIARPPGLPWTAGI